MATNPDEAIPERVMAIAAWRRTKLAQIGQVFKKISGVILYIFQL
jgi:hypothetical protein